jgi:murein DD-endopeptidase MepM/ murein hydrolase activator NlpD
VGWAQSARQGEAQLREVEARVDAVEARLESARGDVAAARRALAEVEGDLAAVEERVNAAAGAVERQRIEVVQAAERLQALEDEAASLDDALERRAVDLFKNGSARGFEVVLAAGDVQAAIDRSAFIDLVSGAGKVELEAVSASRVAVEAQTERFTAESERLLALQADEEALLVQVQRLRDAQASALGGAEAEADSLASERDQLADDAERIERLIREARSTPVATTTPSTSGYLRPICSRVTSNYGYRWGRLHAGTDFDGNTGDPIGASRGGVVISSGYQGGYGNLVLIDHGGGVVTAYAHQSQLLVVRGQRVERGERIGLVGSTGRSTGSHLHFEVRVNGGAVDPRRFLPSGC